MYENCRPSCCTPCVPVCPPCPEPVKKRYAYFSQRNRLYNSALLGGLRFTDEPIATEGFFSDDTVIQILNPGVYLATYIVNFPENAVVNTTLSLQYNNMSTQGTTRTVLKTDTGIPFTAVAQTILIVEQSAAVRLSSSAVIDIAVPPGDTAASLSLIEL